MLRSKQLKQISPRLGRKASPPDGVYEGMHDRRSRRSIGHELVDAVFDAYVSWRERSAAVELSYRDWIRASPGERAVAYDRYVRALDREEHAAGVYGALVRQAELTPAGSDLRPRRGSLESG